IVFDCGFEDTMGMQELRSLTRQLLKAHYYNRELDDPFFFSFCNIEPDSNIWALLQKFHSNQTGQTFDGYSQLPYHFSPRNFTDIFPREDLVMLSPDAKQSMYEVRSDKVYIIGAITDKASSKPLTMSKAKRLGIPCMKLPLHLLKWKGPRKDLGLDVVLQILQMVNEGSAWEDALNHCLPQR
uniref:RNA (guanine-9-)-methyltransferase domain-containing protein 1 n=1 Tax=Capitella teleta TaxID=283909 RepID=X2B243_CAPTE